MPRVSILRDIAYGVGGLAGSPYWGWRMLRTGKWRTDWAGRFGYAPVTPEPRPTLLIHAVSVGEVNAIRQLVTKLEQRHGARLRIVISTTTDTGTTRARELFAPRHAVVRYPLDFTRCVRRLLDRVRPDAVALVELEVWPTFVEECTQRKIPVAVINGRLSERSHRRYMKVRPFVRGAFAQLHAALVQDETYAGRFRDLGVRPDRVAVVGTMKWDTAVIRDDIPGSAELANAMGIDRYKPLVVFGSTGDFEEAGMLVLFRDDDVQLMFAPRKPERFDKVASHMRGPVRRTECPDGVAHPPRGDRHFLLDTLGELGKAYALADVVVVGRTFYPHGGSDMIEPIALGKATIVGPYVDNFQSVVESLRAGRGIVQVEDNTSMREAVVDLLRDTVKRKGLAERGRQVIRKNQGTTDRHVELLESLLPSLSPT